MHRPAHIRRIVTSSPAAPARRRDRRAISLLEVLVSMFVLLFGLVGVLALIPVGNHYLQQATVHDRAAAVGHAAFNQIRTQRLLRPDRWVDGAGDVSIGLPTSSPPPAFAVDPLWYAYGPNNSPPGAHSFPYSSAPVFPEFMLRRVSLRSELAPPGPPFQIIPPAIAEQGFMWDDDLSITLPEDHDQPSQTLAQRDISDAAVQRQFQGDFSWMFTAVPVKHGPGWNPVDGRFTGDTHYEVSVVVFHKRAVDRDLAREYVVQVPEVVGGIGGGEIRIASADPAELEPAREGQWLMLTAWSPDLGVPGARFVAKWYRIISADEVDGGRRWVGLAGPDWDTSLTRVCAILVEDVAAVYTQTMSIPGS
ncbi:MAG: hypothetical protein WDZ59_03655 [Pirellulales bacterium]